MSFRKWLLNTDINTLVPRQQNQRGRRRKRIARRRPALPNIERLEPRNLLAGIFLDTASGDLFVFGDAANDTGSISQVNPTTIRANLAGIPSQAFSTSEFSRIVFLGLGGNDTFANNSSSPSLLLGNDGDDVLTGGGSNDEISGGSGNDQIDGRDGDDRIVGGAGNDTARGGAGDDRIFGTAGVNTLNGDDGDDVMYGGDEIDTINGGEGIDQIFGLAGDDILDAGNGGVAGQPELILGLDGDDTITAGNGVNVLYGGDGNDVISGSTGQNSMFGQNGNDELTGGAGNDYLAGNRGNDIIDGGGGLSDIVAYNGTESVFVIAGSGNQFTVTAINGNVEGVDTVTNSEFFLFNRLAVGAAPQPVAPSAGQTVTIQPVIVATSNGGNRATFLGTAEQEQAIKAEVDRIYAAADVNVEWLAPVNYNNTFASRGTAATRPVNDLFTIVDEGAAALPAVQVSATNLVLDMYFVDTAPGFSNGGPNIVNGLAVFDDDGITVAVGSALPTFEAGQDAVARILAHEIGHNLGLDHVTDRRNLMVLNGGTDTLLTAAQIAAIERSRFTV